MNPDRFAPAQSNRRNKVLAEHAAHILPYRGLGTGVPRALHAWPKIDLVDERDANQFRAVLWRPRNDAVPQQATGEVTGEVQRLLMVMVGEMKRSEIQGALGLKHEDHFRTAYLQPALTAKMIEMTLPDKPRSSKQRYRLTMRGQAALAQPDNKEQNP